MAVTMTETHYQVTKGFSRDAGPYWTATQKYATSADASSTALAITNAPTAGMVCVIDDMLVSTDTDLTLTIRTTGLTAFAKLYCFAYVPLQITFRNGLRSPTVSQAVEILASAAWNIATTVSYHSE